MEKNSALWYAARHGRTKGNELDIYRGHSNEDFAQLSVDGRDDARDAAIYLKRAGLSFPLILADDLARAKETAEIMASVLGIKAIEYDRRLRPLDVGEFTGKPKKDHPLTAYVKDKNKKIPGGESMHQFNRRLALISADIAELVHKMNKPILMIGHGSTISFLKSASEGGKDAGYESVVHPGGVAVFTSQGLFPLFKLKYDENEKPPMKDGTVLTGLVTDEENRPPRECWNCRSVNKDLAGLYGCFHPLVMIDPQVQHLKQADGSIAVGERWCCDYFRNKVAT